MKFNEYLSVSVYKLILVINLINGKALSDKDKTGKQKVFWRRINPYVSAWDGGQVDLTQQYSNPHLLQQEQVADKKERIHQLNLHKTHPKQCKSLREGG